LSEEKEQDIFICYNHGDEKWVQKFASSIESEQFGNRHLSVFLDDWDIVPGHNMINAMERGLKTSRYVGVVISKNSVDAEWPNMERSIAISSDPSGRKGIVIPIWLGDCEIPPSLKMRSVLYCQNDVAYKKSYSKLIAVLKNEKLPRGTHEKPSTNIFNSEQFPVQYEDDVDEQLASNLFPIINIPKIIWSAPTNYSNKEMYDFLRNEIIGILPTFIIKEKKIFCFWDINDKECPFRNILSANVIESHSIYDWIKNENKNRWLMELLNKGLKNYCGKLSLRFDPEHTRYSFLPENQKDRKIQWHTGKRKATRTVVTKHTRGKTEDIFWSHQTLKAKFTTLDEDIFLQLIPGWTFTINGIDQLPSDQIGPLSTKWTTNERNPSLFYHIRFWSSYLSQQSDSIIIPLGNTVCEIDVTPAVIELSKGLQDDLNPIEKVFETANVEIQTTDALRDILIEENEIFVEGSDEHD